MDSQIGQLSQIWQEQTTEMFQHMQRSHSNLLQQMHTQFQSFMAEALQEKPVPAHQTHPIHQWTTAINLDDPALIHLNNGIHNMRHQMVDVQNELDTHGYMLHERSMHA